MKGEECEERIEMKGLRKVKHVFCHVDITCLNRLDHLGSDNTENNAEHISTVDAAQVPNGHGSADAESL